MPKMITGQKPVKPATHGRFQIIDGVDMMRPFTKFTHQLASADIISPRAREAFRLVKEEKPGAMHLEFPKDIAEEHTDMPPIPRSHARRAVPEKKAIRAVINGLARAQTPIIIIGAGAKRQDHLAHAAAVHRTHRHAVRDHAARQRRRRRTSPPVRWQRCAVVRRFRASRDRCRGCHHQNRARCDPETPLFTRTGGVDVVHVKFRSAAVVPEYLPQHEVIGDIADAIWHSK
jgi:acetolactate synthase-1/2/3 large subunit